MSNATKIATLNDMLRKFNAGGTVLKTQAVAALDEAQMKDVRVAMANFNDFNEGNDPYGERDFARFDVDGIDESFMFKIDYYDKSGMYLSEDPSCAAKTNRVMTIMYASEY